MFNHIALQMDAVSSLNPATDTTLSLARVAAERGAQLFAYEPRHLSETISAAGIVLKAWGRPLRFTDNLAQLPELGQPVWRDLTEFDAVLMRQDPPFDLAYIATTHMLEHLRHKVRVINDPVGVRNAPEKLLITHFPQLMPPTLITRDFGAIADFRAQHKEIVVKPLFGHGGHGIFHIREDDDNLPALLEMWAGMNREPWMIQRFLPEIAAGDKRVIIINGKPVGGYARIAAQGDSRANGRVGGSAEISQLTSRDLEICEQIAPTLQAQGLYLVGIDVIGDYLTEINVTSPTGLPVYDRLMGNNGKQRVAEIFWDQL